MNKHYQMGKAVQHISPYVIQNLTGYALEVTRESEQGGAQEPILLNNNESVPISVEEDLEKLLAQRYQGANNSQQSSSSSSQQ